MDKKELVEKLRNDILLFGKVVMPNTFYLPSPKFHQEITSVLNNPIYKHVNIIAPRGSSKSSLVAGVYVLHHLMFHKSKERVVILTSRTQYHAILLLQTIKDILNYSEHFRSVFGYWGQQNAKKWTNSEIFLKDGSAIICKGTGQQVRGLKVGNQRPTLIIIDDPEDENNTKTSEAMESNLRWLLQSCLPSLDSHQGRSIVIGTPLHERCMVMVLKNISSWRSLHYKYINTDENGNKTSLWPEMRSLETLEAIKNDHENIGRLSVFYKEYQCEVIGDEAQLFTKDDIKYYDGYYEDGKIIMADKTIVDVNIFMGIDPASSIKENADFTAIIPIGVDKDKNRYVLPYFRGRLTPLNVADKIISMAKKYKPVKSRIETTGYQEMLREYVRDLANKENIIISGLETKEQPRGAKSNRIESMQPYFKNGKVFLLKNMHELEDELLLYPRGKHDDLLDALFYACKLNYAPVPQETKPLSFIERILSADDDWMLA